MKKKIYMGLPSTGNTSTAQNYALRSLEKKYKHSVEFYYPEKAAFRMFHDFARNCIVQDFMESDCDVLWFLDSDVVPHDCILDYVENHYDNWDMAGAPYPVMMTPHGESTPQVVFTVYKKMQKNDGLAACSIPSEGVDFVDGIATGCIFIKRHVFEKLEKPYFSFKYRESDRFIERGEDLDFCLRTSALGLKFFVNFSYVCRHYKNVDLLDVNNYAIDYANKALINYERKIREELTQIQMKKQFGRKSASPSTPVSALSETTGTHSGVLSTNLGYAKPTGSQPLK